MVQRTDEDGAGAPAPEGTGGRSEPPAQGDPADAGGDAGRAKKSSDPPAGVIRFADRALVFLALLFAMNLFFAFHLHRRPAIKVFAAVGLAATVLLRFRGSPRLRVPVVLALVPAFLGVTGFEILMSRKRPRNGTAAYLRGKPFDSRGLFEVVRDERGIDPTTQSYAIPRALLTHNVAAPPWADEAIAHTVRPDWGLMIDGVQTLPFAGVSMRRTVFCNEGGYWAVYDADEHGYNNPRGIWDKAPLDVVILGDSYSQGACVPPDRITAAYLRGRYPKTLTLGMCANGPLMEYSNLREHVIELKPRIVLWVYYSNDLSDLNVETQSTLLMKYVEDDGFRQDLKERQGPIDAALVKYLDDVAEAVPAWPSPLSAAGLTRQTTPLFIQDLVMREQHSSVTSVLRLDWLTNAVTTRFLERNFYKDEVNWTLFRELLLRARKTVDTWGGKTYFVYLPDVYYLRPGMEQPHRKGVLESAQAAGMNIIDVHAAFMKLPRPDSYRPHYEAHFTEEGFELVGKYILEALARDGL